MSGLDVLCSVIYCAVEVVLWRCDIVKKVSDARKVSVYRRHSPATVNETSRHEGEVSYCTAISHFLLHSESPPHVGGTVRR